MALSIDSLPPYGHLHEGWMKMIASATVPEGFAQTDGKPSTTPQWKDWTSQLAGELATFLWPTRVNGAWTGAARERAIELTEADLALMAQLRQNLEDPIKARLPTKVTHRECFEIEAGEDPPDAQHFAKYDPALSWLALGKMGAALLAGSGSVGPTSLLLKLHLQRPRPYQTAHLLELRGHAYLDAQGATTPSLISGHSIQGCIGGCGMYLAARAELAATHGALELLQQFAVDVGDRRVFAGVHYPSDNLSSWFCGLRFCSRVFGSDAGDVRKFLWDAIRTKSVVYEAVTRAVAADPGSPYAEPLRRLATEAAALP